MTLKRNGQGGHGQSGLGRQSQSRASLKHTTILDQELLDSYMVIQLLLLYDCNFKLTYFRTYNPNKLTWWAPNSMGWVFLLFPLSKIAKSLTLQESKRVGLGPSKSPESLGRRSKDSGK